MKESARKDVECAFVCLNFNGVSFEILHWHRMKGSFWEVMTACVIMHNMIVEDERDDSIFDQGFDFQDDSVEPLH